MTPKEDVDRMREQIGGWPVELAPLANAACRLLQRPSKSSDGVMYIGHQPWVAPEGHAMTLYPGLKQTDLASYGQRFELAGDHIVCLMKTGKRVGEWSCITEWLRDELRASEALDLELHPPDQSR
jgi:hypothetical protein